MTCRICGDSMKEVLDLGLSPPANSLLDFPRIQKKFPLVLELCSTCFNAQLKYCIPEEHLYKNYFYENKTLKKVPLDNLKGSYVLNHF